MKILTWACFLFAVLCLFDSIVCWDNTEMQMFDLVEEVNENFYQYLGVDQNATNADIKRAYRRLSLRYHPDRNPNEEDAIKFRRLVAIYEVLKDEKIRERYNEVLKFGLPDWKMPSFYFRKLRKMSFTESFLLFIILATFIHYCCLWGRYFEEKLIMDYYLSRRKKQRTKESEMNKELNKDYKPGFKDLLPFVIVMFIYHCVLSTPENVKLTCGLVKQEITVAIDKQFEKKRKDKEREEVKKKIEETKKERKERKQILTNENKAKRKIYEIGVHNAMTLPIESFNDIPMIEEQDKEDTTEITRSPWADKDTVALIRALSKYPAGVNDRWLKISEFVKRPLNEVTKKVKEIQTNSKEGKIPINTRMQNSLGDGVEEQFELEQPVIYIQSHLSQDNCSLETESENDDDQINVRSSAQKKKERKNAAKLNTLATVPIKKMNDIVQPLIEKDEHSQSEEVEESNVQLRKKPRTKAKYLESSDPIETSSWTQTEQKQLEDAMRAFPKGTTDRWDRISQKIPTKTKVECIERIKKLSQNIVEKNNNKSAM